MNINIANLVTFFRLALVPGVILCFFSDLALANYWAALLFTIASLSDWLDGYLARSMGIASEFGAFLDPIADKLLVVVVLVILVASYKSLVLATVVLISREILISALREWMAEKGKRDLVAVGFSGKLKTTVQMVSIIALLLYADNMPPWVWDVGFVGIHLSACISVYSMLIYFKRAWSPLRGV